MYLYRYAGAVFGDACLKGLNGVPDIVECSYVQSTITELPVFASKVHVYFATIFCLLQLLFVMRFHVENLDASNVTQQQK